MKDLQNPQFSDSPHCPETAKVMDGYTSLSQMRDKMTSEFVDSDVELQIQTLFDKWKIDNMSIQPYSDIRNILEQVRKLPHSEERVKQMNTIIRTIGKPSNLATLLDMLRDSALREGTVEQDICKTKLQAVKMHSIYGWCGNTLSVESFDTATEGTHTPQLGLQEKLGNPTSAWNLTIHIWQPNKNAKGFLLNKSYSGNTIIEPPHTHPFDFVSMVVKGNMHQSIYKQLGKNDAKNFSSDESGYYNNRELEHVDGVWPPHEFQTKANIKILEHRVALKEGDSYYMPCNWIHDVEIDANMATNKPTITLFLSSEYLVMPHVYMLKSMSEYHKENPNIKQNNAKPISEDSWHKKLNSISAYLRGDSETLDLNSIVNYDGEYAFFHRV